QKELGAFLERQQAEARLHSSIHNFTSICWDKQVALSDFWLGSHTRLRCVTGTPSTRFSRSEESCISNCVERFLDTSLFMVKKIEEQRSAIDAGNTKFT
ncbi:hypothetical protein B0H17DRAFT_919224, partial [Mycena rosella]